MKIKVKRYKEIEKIAIVEAGQRILREELDLNSINQLLSAIAATGVGEDALTAIKSTLMAEAARLAKLKQVGLGGT